MVNSRIRTPFYIFFLTPVYVGARSLRSLHSLPCLPVSGYANTGKKVSYCFYKITSSKNYNAGKDKKKSFFWSKRIFLPHWFDNGFLNWPIKTCILKMLWWRVYNSCIFTSHNHVYILSCKHASQPINSYFINLSYFIKSNTNSMPKLDTCIHFKAKAIFGFA